MKTRRAISDGGRFMRYWQDQPVTIHLSMRNFRFVFGGQGVPCPYGAGWDCARVVWGPRQIPLHYIFTLLLLLALLLVGCSSGSDTIADTVETVVELPPLDDNITVTWAVNGDLFLWRTGDESPATITQGHVMRARLSPDTSQIAFTRGDEGLTRAETLWLIQPDGQNERQIEIPAFILQFEWMDETNLFVNTFDVNELGILPRDDLYHVNTTTRTVTPLSIGGYFSISPAGTQIIAVTAGVYQQQVAQIRRLNLNTDETSTLLEFPAVSTGSHTPFYPQIQWSNENIPYVAIPAADALYQETGLEASAVVVWRFPPNADPGSVATIPASFFGLPVRSPVTGQLVYFRRSATDPNSYALFVSDSDGRNATEYASVENILPVSWLPDGERFIYLDEDAYWLGQQGTAPDRFVGVNPDLVTQPTPLQTGIIYITLRGGRPELRYVPYDEGAVQAVTIAEFAQTTVSFDAISSIAD